MITEEEVSKQFSTLAKKLLAEEANPNHIFGVMLGGGIALAHSMGASREQMQTLLEGFLNMTYQQAVDNRGNKIPKPTPDREGNR